MLKAQWWWYCCKQDIADGIQSVENQVGQKVEPVEKIHERSVKPCMHVLFKVASAVSCIFILSHQALFASTATAVWYLYDSCL